MVNLFRKTNIFIWSRFQTSSGLNKLQQVNTDLINTNLQNIYHKLGSMFSKCGGVDGVNKGKE